MADPCESGCGFRREPSISYHQPLSSQRNQARGSVDLILDALRESLEPSFDTRRSNDLPNRRRRESDAANRLSMSISRLSEDMQERYALGFSFSVGFPQCTRGNAFRDLAS